MAERMGSKSRHPSMRGRRSGAITVQGSLFGDVPAGKVVRKGPVGASLRPPPPPLPARLKTKAKYGKTGRRIYPKTAKVIAMGSGGAKRVGGEIGSAKKAFNQPRRTFAKRKLKVSNKAMGVGAAAGLGAYAAKRYVKKQNVGQKIAQRHPTKVGTQTVKGSVTRNVGKKYHVHADYVITRDPSLVKLNKRGRNTLKGVTPEKGKGARGHHGRAQRRDSRGRFI